MISHPSYELALCANQPMQLIAAIAAAREHALAGITAHDAVDTIRVRFGLTDTQALGVEDLIT